METENKKNTGLIVTIVILSLLVVGLSGYLIYDRILQDNKNAENNDKENNSKEFVTEIIDFKDCNPYDGGTKKVCTETKNINNQTITLKYDLNTSGDNYGVKLYVNDKTIISSEDAVDGINSKVYLLDDIIMFSTYGTDIRTTKMYFYDFNGNKVKEIYNLDTDNYGMVMDSDKDDYTVTDNKITFYGSRLSHGPSLMVDDSKVGNYVPLCQGTEKDKLSSDEIVSAQYTMEYLGNNKFSDIKIVPGTELRLGDFLKRKDAC